MLALMQSDASITLNDIATRWQCDTSFTPQMESKTRRNLLVGWDLAIKRTLTGANWMLSTLFNRLEAWHINHFVRPWLDPLPMSRGGDCDGVANRYCCFCKC